MSPRKGDSRPAAPPSVSQNPLPFFRVGRGPPFPTYTPPPLQDDEKDEEEEEERGRNRSQNSKRDPQTALIHTNLWLTALSLLQWRIMALSAGSQSQTKTFSNNKKYTSTAGSSPGSQLLAQSDIFLFYPQTKHIHSYGQNTRVLPNGLSV